MEQENQQTMENQPTQKTNTMAIVALILAFVCAPVGLILGFISLSQIKKRNEGGKGLAIAAIIISVLITILFVFLIIVPLFFAFFGVMDPGKMLPDRCLFPAGVDCIDKASVTSNTLIFALRNGMGAPIQVDSASSPECGSGATVAIGSGDYMSLPVEVPNNEVFRVQLSGCSNGKSGQTLDTTVELTFTNTASGLSKTVTGDIRGKVS